jgi:non-ribosomal peptide synthetase component F
VPFDRLVEELNPERSLSRHPLFQTMLVLQNNAGAVAAFPGLDVEHRVLDLDVAKFDLTLDVTEDARSGGIAGALKYATDLFDRATATRLADGLVRFLDAVSADPDARLGAVDVLAPDERQQMLVEWNDTATAFPSDVCVHELVAAQDPSRTALVFGDERVSYGELDARANELAWRLIDRGVAPGVTVGVLLERSVELVVAVLAVLKAGGAYTVLDPQFPDDRLAAVVRQAQVPLVVTSPELAERVPRGCGWITP